MKKLYLGKYQHKIMLVVQGAHYLRGGNLDNSVDRIISSRDDYDYYGTKNRATRPQDYELLLNIIDTLRGIEDFTVRVEKCYLSIYVNKPNHIGWLKKVGGNAVREIHFPKVELTVGSVVSTLPYDYKVHAQINRNTDYEGFINWAQDNTNLRVPPRSLRTLQHMNYSQHIYFYVTGEKNLTMAKIHLGAGVKQVEKIINP